MHQPRLKWLLLALLALALAVIVWGVTWMIRDKATPAQGRDMASQQMGDPSTANDTQEPTEEEINAQLEKLKSPDADVKEPTEEEINAQLEKLKSPDADVKEPTEEEINAQLEKLKQ